MKLLLREDGNKGLSFILCFFKRKGFEDEMKLLDDDEGLSSS